MGLLDFSVWGKVGDYRNLKNNRMGVCSSPPLTRVRARQPQQAAASPKNSRKSQPRNVHSSPKNLEGPSQVVPCKETQGQEEVAPPLTAMGQIFALTTGPNLEPFEDFLGVGCLIGSRILLTSDHYLYQYQPEQLIFRPFNHPKRIRIRNCMYPPQGSLPYEKKRSMYLHRRVNFALFLLEDILGMGEGSFLQLGTSLLPDQYEQDSVELMKLRERVIEESSQLIYLHVGMGKGVKERGWPLLYRLHGRYYCIGLYSYPHTTDSILLNEHIVQRFKAAEKKCGLNEQINSVEINEAQLEKQISVCSNREKSLLQQLFEEKEGLQKEAPCQAMDEQLAEIHFRIGIQYGSMGNFKQEKEYYQTAFKLYTAAGFPQNSESFAALHHNLGICQSQLNDFPSALQHLTRSLQIRSALDECQALADTYNQLGVLSRKQCMTVQALSYYYKAYNIYSELEHLQRMALILNNITLLTQDEHTHTANKAKYCDILAILQKTKGENCIEVARVMFNLAALQSQGKNYGTAITALGKAARIMKGLGLQQHSQYREIVELVEDLDARIQDEGERRQWAMKSKALLALI